MERISTQLLTFKNREGKYFKRGIPRDLIGLFIVMKGTV